MNNGKLGITGILLVGGESRRMGRNKAFLEIDGKTLLEKNLEVLTSICSEVLISSRETELYSCYGFEVVEDIIKNKGPLAGLYSALNKARYDCAFVASCDLPFLKREAIEFLYEKLEDYDVVVPQSLEKTHLLHALYRKKILPVLKDNLKQDKLKIHNIVRVLNTRFISLDDIKIDPSMREILQRSVLNANTPEEWNQIVNNNQQCKKI